MNEPRQQRAGLLGALIVRDGRDGAPAGDEVIVLLKAPRGSLTAEPPLQINGQPNPDTVVLHTGRPARVRLISLTYACPNCTVWLTARPDSSFPNLRDTMVVQWRPVAVGVVYGNNDVGAVEYEGFVDPETGERKVRCRCDLPPNVSLLLTAIYGCRYAATVILRLQRNFGVRRRTSHHPRSAIEIFHVQEEVERRWSSGALRQRHNFGAGSQFVNLTVFTRSSPKGEQLMSAEEEVGQASKQFYTALNRMANGDAMSLVWSRVSASLADIE